MGRVAASEATPWQAGRRLGVYFTRRTAFACPARVNEPRVRRTRGGEGLLACFVAKVENCLRASQARRLQPRGARAETVRRTLLMSGAHFCPERVYQLDTAPPPVRMPGTEGSARRRARHPPHSSLTGFPGLSNAFFSAVGVARLKLLDSSVFAEQGKARLPLTRAGPVQPSLGWGGAPTRGGAPNQATRVSL